MIYQVLLYYNFTPVADPQKERDAMDQFCTDNNLLGRILVGKEGLNGTVGGLEKDVKAYIDWMEKHPLFGDTEFKIDALDYVPFLKMHVRVKNEIVHFSAEDFDVHRPVDNYIEPEEFQEILKQESGDFVILDARSNYEHELGKFKGALTLDIENFRELPKALEDLEHLKDTTIYTYCTGGIKCEKVSRLMEDRGFKNVFQLHGGIVRYGHETGGENFEGTCYVFDQRVSTAVNEVNPVAIGNCKVCEGSTELMINCANPDCNAHILICRDCVEKQKGCCSEPCMSSPRRRVFDGRGYYMRGVNSKLYSESPDPNYVRYNEPK